MIRIDFMGGSHGNFLAYVLNRFLAGIDVHGDVFNNIGAAHHAEYITDPWFVCDHYTMDGADLRDQTLIMIQPEPRDLVALQCTTLVRAGEFNLDPSELMKDTWHKLDQPVRHNLRETIHGAYFANTDRIWDARNPDCPTWILRDFFRCGFLAPQNHGLVATMRDSTLRSKNRVRDWMFGNFYHAQRFVSGVQDLAVWLRMPLRDPDQLLLLHQRFLDRQPYHQLESQCWDLVNCVLQGLDRDCAGVNVVAQAYIESRLQHLTGFDRWGEANDWFPSTIAISQHMNVHAS